MREAHRSVRGGVGYQSDAEGDQRPGAARESRHQERAREYHGAGAERQGLSARERQDWQG